MDRRTFAVERLGVGDWPDPDGDAQAAIDPKVWAALTDVQSEPAGPVWFAFDVSPDRSWAAIGVAGKRPDGVGHIEIVDHKPGVGWVVPRLLDLVAKHENGGVVCDASGPAFSLVPALERAGVEPLCVSAKDHSQACGLLQDEANNGSFRHLGQSDLASAVRGAAKRPLGDAYAWARRTSAVDITPLVAVTLAFWAARGQREKTLLPPMFA